MIWQLPPPRRFGWPMKSVRSAQTNCRRLPHGSFELLIDHELVRGVTPAMLEWWFRHLDGTMRYQGQEYPRYLVWHPTDHIHWQLTRPAAGGHMGVGSHCHLVKAIGGDTRKLIDSHKEVEKLDETGLRLVRKVLGTQVFCQEHWFAPTEGGTRIRTRMQVGAESLLGQRVYNPVIQRLYFTAHMGYAWLKHMVEAFGNFEFFLPELYAAETSEKATELAS